MRVPPTFSASPCRRPNVRVGEAGASTAPDAPSPARAASLMTVLAGLLVTVTAGCAGFDDMRYEHVQKKRTCSAWRCYDSQSSCHYGCDYEEGWKAGYYDVLTGGCGEPPVVAPRKYWNPHKIINHCDQKRNRWYVGFQDGAAAAKRCPDTHYLKLWMPPAMGRPAVGCPVGPGPAVGTELNSTIAPTAPAVNLGTPLPAPAAEDDEDEDEGDEQDDEDATDIPAPPSEVDEEDEEYAPGLSDDGNETTDEAAPVEKESKQETFAERLRRMAEPNDRSGEDAAGGGSGGGSDSPELPAQLAPPANPVMPVMPSQGVSRSSKRGGIDFSQPTPRELPAYLMPTQRRSAAVVEVEPVAAPVEEPVPFGTVSDPSTVETIEAQAAEPTDEPVIEAKAEPQFALPMQPIATAGKRASGTTRPNVKSDAADPSDTDATPATPTAGEWYEPTVVEADPVAAAAERMADSMRSVVGEAAQTVTLDTLGEGGSEEATLESFDLGGPVDVTAAGGAKATATPTEPAASKAATVQFDLSPVAVNTAAKSEAASIEAAKADTATTDAATRETAGVAPQAAPRQTLTNNPFALYAESYVTRSPIDVTEAAAEPVAEEAAPQATEPKPVFTLGQTIEGGGKAEVIRTDEPVAQADATETTAKPSFELSTPISGGGKAVIRPVSY